MVNGSLGRLGDLLHEFFLVYAPVVAVLGVDPHLAYMSVCASDTYILVASAKAAHGVALEVGEHKH